MKTEKVHALSKACLMVNHDQVPENIPQLELYHQNLGM
jgi:hypothetical protein